MVKKHWQEIILFLGFFLLYTTTSSHTVIQGDTGEFLSVASTGGVAHPPGYPLYSFLVWIIYALTKNAWFINISSAFFGALTVVTAYRITQLLTKKDASALFSALALGTYEVFWFYSLVAQIHIFYVFVESLILYSLLIAVKKKTKKSFYITSLLLGIGVATHQVTAFLLPACFYTLYIVRKHIALKTIAICVPISLLGLLSYLYVVIASSNNPAVNWGVVHDLQSLLRLFLRFDYGIFLLSKAESPAPFIYSTFVFYCIDLFTKSWFLVPFAAISLAAIKKNISYRILLLAFIFMGPFYYFLMNIPNRSIVYQSTLEQYIPYSFLFFAILCGVGLSIFQTKFSNIKTSIIIATMLFVFLLVAIVAHQKVNLSNNTLVIDTTHFQLTQIPKNGILLTWSDSIFLPIAYVQYVEKKRPDITVVQLGLMNTPWYKDHLKRLHPEIKNLVGKDFDYKKACSLFGANENLFIYPYFTEYESIFGDKCEVVPFGLINRVIIKNPNQDLKNLKSNNDNIWKNYLASVHPLTYKDRSTRTQEALYYLAEQKNFTGTYYLLHKKALWALEEFEESKKLSRYEANALISESVVFFNERKTNEAINALNEAEQRAPATIDIYKNRGLIYGKLGQEDNAYSDLKKYIEFKPTDPQAEAIKSFLHEYEKKRGQTTIY